MREIRRVAVIGAGTMGRQIALQCARHGFPVALFDVQSWPRWLRPNAGSVRSRGAGSRLAN